MRKLHWVFGGLVLGLLPVAANAGISVTIDAPGVETSQVGGVTTETFDEISPTNTDYTSLVTAVGTITASSPGFEIRQADQYGGAGGTGNYLGVAKWTSPNTTATLTLSGGALSYFGFWLSALDANNQIFVYSGGVGGTLLETIDESTTGTNITAINTLIGGNTAYNGNPSGAFEGDDDGETFQYINITGTAGTTFDTIVFANSDSTGTGNEVDNFSIIPATTVPLPSAGGAGLLALLVTAAAFGLRRAGRQVC